MTSKSRHPLLRGTALVICATAMLYGCKDFLNTASEPQGALDAKTLSNPIGIEGSLIGAYRALDCTVNTSSNWGCAASNWVFGSVASDDSYKGSDGLDQPPINDIEGYHWGTPAAGDYLNAKWVQSYEGVVRSNSTLRLLNQVLTANPTAFVTSSSDGVADVRSITGEALFLRAHYHFEAWRMWGNIPYYRENDTTDFRKANIDSTQVAVELLKDLDSAIKMLPATPRNGEVGRATSWTAKAYKGRVQLYDHQYANAQATFRDIVENGPYALESSFDRVWSAYQDASNGPETIFAFQASANDGEPGAANANYGERLNFPYAPSHFQCCGFNPPTQNLVNVYQVDPVTGLPLSITSPSTWNVSDTDFKAGNLTPVDPRLDWTVGRKGVPYKDWGLYDTTWVRDPGNGGPYSPKKPIHEKGSGAEATVGWQPQQQSSINIHLFRYADLLLMLAEADVEQNDLVEANDIVNQIRTRAGVTAQGPGTDRADMAVPINDPSITWAKYQVGLYPPFADQNSAREAVRTERRLELAMEGQRFFDLRRWGVTAAVINGYLNGGPTTAGGGGGGGKEASVARRAYLEAAEPIAARHRWFPLPVIQVELSKTGGTSTLKQNTGW
jgi:hypothetical protein